MERDIRRGRGQWKGCHSFHGIIPEHGALGASANPSSNNKRTGGLRMGHTYYYYVSPRGTHIISCLHTLVLFLHFHSTRKLTCACFQYELDGSTETHDPAMPSTTACPYLPGQTVNTMNVPVEKTLRRRSASLSSVCASNFQTLNPQSKFITPRPVPAIPPVPSDPAAFELRANPVRMGSAPCLTELKLGSRRSLSPSTAWRRIFARKLPSRDNSRARSQDSDDRSMGSSGAVDGSRSSTPSEGVRTRDMSPESLRRFLSDESPPRPDSATLSERPSVLLIPEDIVEENEDDDNFATSAVSETESFPTTLSPPPRRLGTPETFPFPISNASALTLIPTRPASPRNRTPGQRTPTNLPLSPTFPRLGTLSQQPSSFSSASSSLLSSPVSVHSPEEEYTSFYDSNDEDDMLSTTDDDALSYQPQPDMPTQTRDFEGYSLPQQGDMGKPSPNANLPFTHVNSPQLLARSDASMTVSGSNLLGTTIDSGLDDFASELGWIVDTIAKSS